MQLQVINRGGTVVQFRFTTSWGTYASWSFDTPDWRKRAVQMSRQHKVPLVVKTS